MRPWTWRVAFSSLCGCAVYLAVASEDPSFCGAYMLLAVFSLMGALSVRARRLY